MARTPALDAAPQPNDMTQNQIRDEAAVTFFHEGAHGYAVKHYQDNARSFMTVRQEAVLEQVDAAGLPAGAAVLDAGCGPGYLVEALAARGLRVSALDAAAGMLEEAQKRVAAAQPTYPVRFDQGNIEHLPYDDASFDLVCSTGVIEYLDGDAQVLSEFVRVLRPGGTLVLPVTNPWSPINWFDFVIEGIKRTDALRNPLNRLLRLGGLHELRPRNFRVRRHSPRAFRASVRAAGMRIVDEHYFYLLPWPHPVDQLLPGVTAALGRRLEPMRRSLVGPTGEGFLVRARKEGAAASAGEGLQR